MLPTLSKIKTKNVKWLAILLLGNFLLSACTNSEVDTASYPERPITYIVPWAAGGMTDISSRVMGATLQQQLGTPVNVVNRTGGGGVVGHLALSKAKPDGYTLGAVTVEITMLNHMGLTDLTYESYTPLALLINNAAAITVKADAPWNSVGDLIAAIKADPGKLNASGTARGGIWDLARIGFLKEAGLSPSDLPWVPSQGSTPALQELIAGGIDVVTASLTEVNALLKAGQVKTLAVMSEDRLASFPDIPTLKEQGMDWSIGGWVSICAPAGIPAAIKTKLEEALIKASKESGFIDPLTKAGSTIQFVVGEEFEQFIKQQHQLNETLMEAAGMKK